MKFSGLILAFTAVACSAVHPTTPSHTALADELASETVALVDESRVYCSGVWISATDILTAAHCVSDLSPGDVVHYAVRRDVTHAGSDEFVAERTGTLARVDANHDLALVRVAVAPPHGIARTSSTPLLPGEVTCTMGHPLGLWWSFSCGEVAAVRWLDDGLSPAPQWWLQTTAPISPGNSGGGLFDEQGALLGIAHASFVRGQNLNLYVHRQYVTAFLAGRS